MATIDITGIGFFMPLISFVFATMVMFAILQKFKILGESGGINIVVAVILGIIFASVSDTRSFVESVIPYFTILVIIGFFVLFLGLFMTAGSKSITHPAVGWVFIGILAIIILVSAFSSFNIASNPDYTTFKDSIFTAEYAGSIWLVIVAIVVGIIITRK